MSPGGALGALALRSSLEGPQLRHAFEATWDLSSRTRMVMYEPFINAFHRRFKTGITRAPMIEGKILEAERSLTKDTLQM